MEWLKEGVRKWNKRRKKVAFSPDLKRVRLFDFLPPDFRDSPKTSRYFEKIDLSGADLTDADLSGLNFSYANFKQAALTRSNMKLSNFNHADFTEADLEGADADNSTFVEAKFDRTNLINAQLGQIDVRRAIFIESPISASQRYGLQLTDNQVFDSRSSYAKARESDRAFFGEPAFGMAKQADTRTRKNRYDVFFGTCRDPIFERGTLVGFGTRLHHEVNYGICEVIVPDSHKIGSLGSSLFKRLLNRSDDRLRLEDMIVLNSELFWKHLNATADLMKEKERPTIFIHGYNTTFEQGVVRAAQIGFDLRIGQGIGLFSWPSQGSTLKYLGDEAAAEASKYLLADFIEAFVSRAQQKSINIIAHSMGCRCLLLALEVLASRNLRAVEAINQLILAAADVDTSLMPKLGRHAVDNCTRTTSYASDMDKALRVSTWLHSFPRIGVTPPTFVLDGMDTVLVNREDLGDFAHGYISTSRTILGDIFSLLKYNLAPSNRAFMEKEDYDGSTYWRLKE